MEPDYLKLAIQAVRDLLINSLQKEEYCRCRNIGRCLEGLVQEKNMNYGTVGSDSKIPETPPAIRSNL